jgi:hypothetical protein
MALKRFPQNTVFLILRRQSLLLALKISFKYSWGINPVGQSKNQVLILRSKYKTPSSYRIEKVSTSKEPSILLLQILQKKIQNPKPFLLG